MAGRRFWIVGTARNAARPLPRSIRHLRHVFSAFGEPIFFVVESNSSDRTRQVLQDLCGEIPNFSFESVEGLPGGDQFRNTRLATCRNAYLDYLSQQQLNSEDVVVVADLDGVNHRLSSQGVANSLQQTNWDILTSNQRGPYYDLWTLRHPVWCPSDYREYFEFLVEAGYSEWTAHRLSVRVRQLKIPPKMGLIEVESAFGGLGLYRPWVMDTARYNGFTPDGRPVGEHVPFNLSARRAGARIFINARMINARKTEHTNTLALAMNQASGRIRRLFNG
jgi:glycosyltransferase involved in cell wall biosynthesis